MFEAFLLSEKRRLSSKCVRKEWQILQENIHKLIFFICKDLSCFSRSFFLLFHHLYHSTVTFFSLFFLKKLLFFFHFSFFYLFPTIFSVCLYFSLFNMTAEFYIYFSPILTFFLSLERLFLLSFYILPNERSSCRWNWILVMAKRLSEEKKSEYVGNTFWIELKKFQCYLRFQVLQKTFR